MIDFSTKRIDRMREFTVDTKTAAKVHVLEGSECISVFSHKSAYSINGHYKLDKKHYDQLETLDTAAKVIKFAKANQLKPGLDKARIKPLVSHSGKTVNEPHLANMDGSLLPKEKIVVFKGDKVLAPIPESWEDVLSNNNGDNLFVVMKSSSFGRDAEMVEIAILDADENVVLHSLVKHSSYVKWIQKSAIAEHSINNSDVKRAPSLARLWPKIKDVVADKKLIFDYFGFYQKLATTSYETAFDCLNTRLTFSEMLPLNISVCLRQYYRFCWQDLSFNGIARSQDLNSACGQQSIVYDDLPDQRAVSDAIKLVRLYHHLRSNLSA